MAMLPKYNVPQVPVKNSKLFLISTIFLALFLVFQLNLLLLNKPRSFLNDDSDKLSREFDLIKQKLDFIDYSYQEIRSQLDSITNNKTTKPRFDHDYDLIIGISTIYRNSRGEAYLLSTLTRILNSIQASQNILNSNVLILLQISEPDDTKKLKILNSVQTLFSKFIVSGLLKIYFSYKAPENQIITDNFNDGIIRAEWRTKQNLDIIQLWTKSFENFNAAYYLHLEDDVISDQNFIQTVFTEIERNPDFFVLDFSGIGFIGKLFQTDKLKDLTTYYKLFYSELPCDWIFANYLRTKYCNLDWKKDDCEQLIALNKITVKPPVFKHFGRKSSLSGKEQLTSREIAENRGDFKIRFNDAGVKERFYLNQFPIDVVSDLELYLELTIGIISVINIEFDREVFFELKIDDKMIFSNSSNKFHLQNILHVNINNNLPKLFITFKHLKPTFRLTDLYIAAF